MNTYHLKYFLDAAKENSISRSAEANYVTHAAVSLGIRALENELGVRLLRHSKRKFELTEEGQLLHELGWNILSNFKDLKESISEKSQEPSGQLIIWAPQSLILDRIATKILKYKKMYPKVKLIVKTGAASVVRQNVESEGAHLGFLVDDENTDSFTSQEIDHGEFVLVYHKKINLNSALEFMVTSLEKVEVNHLFREYRKKIKLDPKIALEVMSWTLIRSMALNKVAIGYLPDYLVRHDLREGRLFQVSTTWKNYNYSIKAIWNKKRSLTRNAQIFLDLLKN